MVITEKTHIRWSVIWQVVLFIFASVLASHTFSQDYNFRNFTSSDGLAQSYVYSITQDEKGYLWIGTGNGLSRYNGFVFENYTTSDSLADNFISCGITDGQSIWFGHINGGLSFYNGKDFQIIGTPVSDFDPVTNFSKSPDGGIWMSTYSGQLMKLSKGKGVIEHYSFKTAENIISFGFFDGSELLIGTNTGLWYCRLKEPGEIEKIRTFTEIPESKVTCIKRMRTKAGFYIATENEGIYKLTSENKRFQLAEIASDSEIYFSGLQYIYEDTRSDLWLGTMGNGLIIMDYNDSGTLVKIDVFNKDHGFFSDNVKTIFEDREGNIWSGNYGEGLTQITYKTFNVHTFDDAIYGNNIFSVYSDQQYRWIGTEKGMLKQDPVSGRVIKFYSKGTGLPEGMVAAIYSADGKELWIGTNKNGIFRMDIERDKISRYPVGDGELENSITSITGEKEQIWIGTKKGLCNIHTGTNRIKWYSISQGSLPHNFINCLYIDKSGKLWISSHSNMLAYIVDEEVHKLPVISGKGALTLGPITEDADSLIWVGSNGNGVFRIGADSITNITTGEGLLSDFCYSIICDNNNNLWVGHKGGISKIRTTDYFVKPIHYFENTTDNYQFNPNAIFKDPQGKILFGSDNGLVSYNPSVEITRQPPPVPEIVSFKVNDEEMDYISPVILKPGKYKIRVDFLAVSLKEPGLVTYQYKLEGYDDAWSDIAKSTNVTYDHVTEGVYTFILNASSGDGIVSENPLTVGLIIKKPVWKHWWFYTLMVLLIIILVNIYIKRREYVFLAEKRILEEKVQERTREIQSQKDEIELQRNLINSKNIEITSSIRYAGTIQQAVLPSFELINRLLPDNFIFFKPKDIVSGDFYWLSEKDNKIIIAVADCTGHGVPGAFMSLLSITMINEIVNAQGIIRPDTIVNKLRDKIIYSLHDDQVDGLDIALCVLDSKEGQIQYTGAMNHLVHVRKGKLKVIEADRFSINSMLEDFGYFTMKKIDFNKGDTIYLFSDGYKDQFGGDQDKKYSNKRFYATLLEIHQLPMKKQKEVLEKKLTKWMKDNIQTDDITVMGIRL
jgi:ligand-binding sensor domain-containing protein/serine phosphatase RsbU (regulator of sigma subunit)